MKIVYILIAVSILHSCNGEIVTVKSNDYTAKADCEKDAEIFIAKHPGEYSKTFCDAVAVKP